MNTDTSYKIVKLTNGEEVICQLGDEIINDEYISFLFEDSETTLNDSINILKNWL